HGFALAAYVVEEVVVITGALLSAAILWLSKQLRQRATLLGRIYYTQAAVQAVLCLFFLNYWNFIGFRFG
ncbi:unnamed protein product, partial [marine sediment metagenome]